MAKNWCGANGWAPKAWKGMRVQIMSIFPQLNRDIIFSGEVCGSVAIKFGSFKGVVGLSDLLNKSPLMYRFY